MKTKLFSLLLAIAVSVGTMFAEKVQIGDLYYNLNATEQTAEVTYKSYANYRYNEGWNITTANIPASVTYSGTTYSVTSIGEHAFYDCSSLTSIEIPNSVTSIGDNAFAECSSLTSVTIPNSVTSIGDRAFAFCSSLTSVTIPNSVTSIGYEAFYACRSLTSVTIPNSVTSIGDRAFEYCSGLTKVNITDIAAWCNITFGGSGANPFNTAKHLFVNGVEVTNLVIPSSVTSIGDYAFYRCSGLTSVTIPNSVTSIGSDAFHACSSLTSVTIGNSVTSIGKEAFAYCSSLTAIVFGTSVRVIEKYAFYGCTAIEIITCYSMRPPTVNNGAFEALPYSTIIYVPADYLNTYKMHDFWGQYDVRPIGATTTETTEVKVEPTTTTADVTWPVVENAATYELVIKDKNGNVVCTLIFNANGQLTQITFNAPARDKAAQAAGFSFTVTGLEEGTSYDLTITAKDENGTTLNEKTIAFTTSGETGVDALQADDQRSNKIFRNGQLLILRDGKTYSIQGVEVK